MMVRRTIFFSIHRVNLSSVIPKRAEQSCNGNFSFAVDFHGHHVRCAGIEFQPSTAVGNKFGMAQIQPAGIFLFGEISTRTAQQLTDDNPLGHRW